MTILGDEVYDVAFVDVIGERSVVVRERCDGVLLLLERIFIVLEDDISLWMMKRIVVYESSLCDGFIVIE